VQHLGQFGRWFDPAIPNAVNIHVSFSYPKSAMPVGLQGLGPMMTIFSLRVPGGSRSSWLE